VDAELSSGTPSGQLEAVFWLCAALDDKAGAERCLQVIVEKDDARALYGIKSDLAERSFRALAKLWCSELVNSATEWLFYPATWSKSRFGEVYCRTNLPQGYAVE
jgi:hypothetical protein